MADEPTAALATEPAPAAVPVEAARPQPTLAELLNSAPVEELVKHPRFAGILGQREQLLRERIKQDITEENEKKAREDAEKELLKLANEDPLTFTQRYLSQKEQDRIKEQQEKVQESVRSELAAQIGKTFKDLPEWNELTPDEWTKLQNAVAGKSDQEALGAFNLAALEIVSERRSAKKLATWRQGELAKEREAIRAEEAAKLLASSPRPDMARGTQPSAFDPTKLSDKEFDEWYRKNQLGRI